MATEFIVIPFAEVRKKLKAGLSEKFKTEELARRAAIRIGSLKAGAIAISQDVDAETEYFGPPRVLQTVGHVPEDFLAALVG